MVLVMPKVYSTDFRFQVLKSLERGKSREEVCDFFGIGVATLCRWLQRYRKTGSISASARGDYKTRKVDVSELLRLIESTPDATLQELADQFETWPSVIDYHLRKQKITRKKNNAVSGAKRGKKGRIQGQDRAARSG